MNIDQSELNPNNFIGLEFPVQKGPFADYKTINNPATASDGTPITKKITNCSYVNTHAGLFVSIDNGQSGYILNFNTMLEILVLNKKSKGEKNVTTDL